MNQKIIYVDPRAGCDFINEFQVDTSIVLHT